MKKVLLLDNGQPFNVDEYLHRPIGGSEASLLMLAKGISNSNHSAVILNNSKQVSNSYNLLINNISLRHEYANISDIIIFNRFIDIDILNNNKDKTLLYYCHDAYDQENTHWMVDKDLVNKFDKILCVSQWQKESFIKLFNVDKSKLIVINNSLDLDLFTGYTKRDPNKLVYASIPYKGLDFLDVMINDLVYKTKNDKLKLHVFSSMNLYGREDGDQEYAETFRKLSHNKNIILRDVVSMKTLASEFASSSVYLHPNTYHETFGMVLTQAQAAGCDVVTTNLGATKEVVYDIDTCIVDSPNIYLTSTYDKFIDLVINKLNLDNKTKYKNNIKMQNFVKQFNYLEIAKKVLKLEANV